MSTRGENREPGGKMIQFPDFHVVFETLPLISDFIMCLIQFLRRSLTIMFVLVEFRELSLKVSVNGFPFVLKLS
jgi:hypothetical protein